MSTVAPEAIDSKTIQAIALDTLALAAKIAALTPTTVDDSIIATTTDLIQRPLVWAIIARIIDRAAPASTEEITNAVMAGFGDDDKPQAVDVAAIVALVTWALPLIQQAVAAWRKRRQNAEPAPAPQPTV